MATNKNIVLAFFTLVHLTEILCSDCELKVRRDFSDPPAAFVYNGKLLKSNEAQGAVRLPANSSVLVLCPGEGTYVRIGNNTTIYKYIRVTCLSKQKFKSYSWSGKFKELGCNKTPYTSAKYSNRTCFNNHGIIQVGYKMEDKFYKVYEVCFNNQTLSPIYSLHELSPASQFHQHGRRPSFFASTFFDGVPIQKIYGLKSTRGRFVYLFGPELAEKYCSSSQYLNRGHLAARADFLFKSEQKGSFLYANIAPQWNRHNAGNWQALESGLRKLASDRNTSLVLYTGVYGVTNLPDATGKSTDIYLYTDANNNQQIPVPMYYYKVVYEPSTKRGMAFVTINNPHYSVERLKELTFCQDLCRTEDLRWLKWRPDDVTAGYSFCCSVENFNTTVTHLPNIQIEGIFL